MANVQELFKQLAQKAGLDLTSSDFQTFISASSLREIEVPETVLNNLNKGLMNKDAAINNPDVYSEIDKKAWGRHMSIMDRKLTKILDGLPDLLTQEQKDEILGAEETHLKYELLTKYLPQNVQEKIKAIPAGKKSDEEIRKIESDYNSKIKQINEEWEGKWKQKEQEIKQKDISNTLTQKIFGYNLVDNIAGGKDYLANAIISELSNTYHLEKSDSGLDLRRKDDPTKEVYSDNNEKVTIETLLAQKLEPFVKKNNGKQSDKEGYVPVQKQQFNGNQPLSLAEMNRQAIQEKSRALLAKQKENIKE